MWQCDYIEMTRKIFFWAIIELENQGEEILSRGAGRERYRQRNPVSNGEHTRTDLRDSPYGFKMINN